MDTSILKEKLISGLNQVDNPYVLQEISKILEIEQQDIEGMKLSEIQKSLLTVSLNQIKNKEYLTEEEANKDIEEWFNNQPYEKDNLD